MQSNNTLASEGGSPVNLSTAAAQACWMSQQVVLDKGSVAVPRRILDAAACALHAFDAQLQQREGRG